MSAMRRSKLDKAKDGLASAQAKCSHLTRERDAARADRADLLRIVRTLVTARDEDNWGEIAAALTEGAEIIRRLDHE